jgi:hypothetical protein
MTPSTCSNELSLQPFLRFAAVSPGVPARLAVLRLGTTALVAEPPLPHAVSGHGLGCLT